MAKLSIDNKFNRVLSMIFDIAALNVFWILCSLPIFTIGASTAALYNVTLKIVRKEEGPVTKSYFREFKNFFKASLPLAIPYVIVNIVLILDLHIFSGNVDETSPFYNISTSFYQSGASSFFYGVVLVLLVVIAAIFTYVFPLLSWFENTAGNTFKNGARLALSRLPFTLLMTALNLLPVILFIEVPGILFHIIWIYIFFGFSGTAIINSFILRKIFDELAGPTTYDEMKDEEREKSGTGHYSQNQGAQIIDRETLDFIRNGNKSTDKGEKDD